MNVYEARHAGREYCCKTEGSDHYKEGGVEPLDLMIAKGLAEDFCIGNMSKYAFRFKKTRNLEDLKKVSDYAHILCGVELSKIKEAEKTIPVTPEESVKPWSKNDNIRLIRLCELQCEKCPLQMSSTTNGRGIDCSGFCAQFPAETRAIMGRREAEHEAK